MGMQEAEANSGQGEACTAGCPPPFLLAPSALSGQRVRAEDSWNEPSGPAGCIIHESAG